MSRSSLSFAFLNVGHFLDHFFMLIFASVAALYLSGAWDIPYSELIPYATPGFVAFAVFALASGWIADHWSRRGMMVIFFLGIGFSSILTGLANTPLQIAAGLFCIGVFASIYHPVGLAMVVEARKKTGTALAVNGVYGNLGVASAALITGILIDTSGWRSAFYLPGILCTLIGVLYLIFLRSESTQTPNQFEPKTVAGDEQKQHSMKALLPVFSVIFFTTALGGLIFQSTTFSLPRVFSESLQGSATIIGWYAFVVFSVAALAQLVVGYLLDRQPVRLIFAVVASMQMLLFFVMTQTSGYASLAVAVGFMLFVFGQIPINDVLVARLVKSEWRSRAYAIRYIVTFSVTAVSVPFIAWIHGNWGFGMLFTVLSFAAALILTACWFLPARNRQGVQVEAA